MKRCVAILLGLLWCCPLIHGQSKTTVTGTVQGPTGVAATSGYVEFRINPASSSVAYRVTGTTALAPQSSRCLINATGQVVAATGVGACQVWGNTVIQPASTCYDIAIAPQNTVRSTIQRQLISGAGYDLSTPVFCPNVNLVPQYQTITTAPIAANLVPAADRAFNLGDSGHYYAQAYIDALSAGSIGDLDSLNVKLFNNTRECNRYTGSDDGAKIQACINDVPSSGGVADATGLLGVLSASTSITIGSSAKPVVLRLNPGATVRFGSGAGFIGANGAFVDGGGTKCRESGKCATITRAGGTTPLFQAVGAVGNHVRGFGMRGLILDGNGSAGHGIVLQYVDTAYIGDVTVTNGGAGNAFRALDEVWDTWITDSAFTIYGDATNPIMYLAGTDLNHQITDLHFSDLQLGEIGTNAPILISNNWVLRIIWSGVKFHQTGSGMVYGVDWSGYQSIFDACTFQADSAAASGGYFRIKNVDNSITSAEFVDMNNGPAIQLIGPGELLLSGSAFRGAGGASASIGVKMDATSVGGLIAGINKFAGFLKAYDISTGSGRAALGPSDYTDVGTPVDSTSPGASWTTFNMGKGGISGGSATFTNGTFTGLFRTGDAAVPANNGDVAIKRTGSSLGAIYFDDATARQVCAGGATDTCEWYLNDTLKLQLANTQLNGSGVSFNTDGTYKVADTQVVGARAAAVADVTGTAGGSYTATEEGMINDLKAAVNSLLAKLRTHGLIAP